VNAGDRVVVTLEHGELRCAVNEARSNLDDPDRPG
jgi:hypothetical protein